MIACRDLYRSAETFGRSVQERMGRPLVPEEHGSPHGSAQGLEWAERAMSGLVRATQLCNPVGRDLGSQQGSGHLAYTYELLVLCYVK